MFTSLLAFHPYLPPAQTADPEILFPLLPGAESSTQTKPYDTFLF